jgi:hypothetical protein
MYTALEDQNTKIKPELHSETGYYCHNCKGNLETNTEILRTYTVIILYILNTKEI